MTKMRYDSGVFYSLRCSVSGNKCRVRPGRYQSLGRSFRIPQITHRSAAYFRRFRSANYFPHFRKLPTPVLLLYSNKNKKFELRLTRRAKAYGSFCSQTVSLSPAVFTKDWPTTVK